MQNKKQYPENWADEIRPAILKRDGYKCTVCGVRHRSFIVWMSQDMWKYIDRDEVADFIADGKKAYQVFLQVCHLNHIKSDCRPENLITKCQRHHHIGDAQHKALMRIAKLMERRDSEG